MNIQASLEIGTRLYTGDVVQHTNTRHLGIVLEIGRTHRDGSVEYLVRTNCPGEPTDETYWRKTEWNSQHVERVPGRDPYRRYLTLCTIEDDPVGHARRAVHPKRRVRRDGGWLPEALWEKMYWRLTNRHRLLPAGGYVSYSLGREHWEKARNDCLTRRDRSRTACIVAQP